MSNFVRTVVKVWSRRSTAAVCSLLFLLLLATVLGVGVLLVDVSLELPFRTLNEVVAVALFRFIFGALRRCSIFPWWCLSLLLLWQSAVDH